jgi:hypothetical protein
VFFLSADATVMATVGWELKENNKISFEMAAVFHLIIGLIEFCILYILHVLLAHWTAGAYMHTYDRSTQQDHYLVS